MFDYAICYAISSWTVTMHLECNKYMYIDWDSHVSASTLNMSFLYMIWMVYKTRHSHRARCVISATYSSGNAYYASGDSSLNIGLNI